MTDVLSSVGIEAVECLAEGERSVTIRVTGRWRRRRPELRGQPMLVIDTPIGRQRFLAMPEPPSLTGAAPGTWRMSFSVPAGLAPSLRGRTFLQLGGAMVPLPIGDVPSPEPAEGARPQVTEPPGVARLERALDEAHAQSDRLRDELTDRERRLRSAEQHAHSERALRAEVEEQLTRRSRAAQHDLRVLHERVADLERELTRMRRAVDEAQHLAAAAEAGRADAARRLSERAAPPPSSPFPSPTPPPSPPAAPRAGPTRHELELSRASRGAPPSSSSVARPSERAGDRVALRQEAAMSEHRVAGNGPARLAALERELAAAYDEIEVQRRRSARAYEAIALVRADLRALRAAAAAPQASAPPLPPPTVAVAPASIQAEQLSAALARLRQQDPPPVVDPPAPAPPAPVAPAPAPPGSAEPARPPAEETVPAAAPAAALATTPAAAPAITPAATRPWLGAAFRKLAAEDPSVAGRVLLGLLPAQRAADPRPVAYDLVMSDVLVAHVTVGSAGESVELDATTRPLSEVDFRVVGDLARIARLLAAGPVRRRVGRLVPGRLARLRGDRGRLAALDGLLAARLGLAQLDAAGVRLDPLLALTLAAVMIEPAWTAGERLTLAHREAAATAPHAYLLVRDGRPALASADPPHEPVATVVACPGDRLLAALGGVVGPGEVVGDQRPLALLGQWLHRAQCG